MAYYQCSGYDTSRVTAAAGDILTGKTVIGSAGEVINGSIPINQGGTIGAASQARTVINGGTYVSGNLVLAALSASNLAPENIKKGVAVKVNNGLSDILSVTGTFSPSASLSRVVIGAGGYSAPQYKVQENDILICSSQSRLSFNIPDGLPPYVRANPYGCPTYPPDTADLQNRGITYDQVSEFVSRIKYPVPGFNSSDPVDEVRTVLYEDASSDWIYSDVGCRVWIGKIKKTVWATFGWGTVNIILSQ